MSEFPRYNFPRYIDPKHSKTYEQIRADAIQDDADEAINKLHRSVKNGSFNGCIDLTLKFPYETDQELRSRGFFVTNNVLITTLCFKE